MDQKKQMTQWAVCDGKLNRSGAVKRERDDESNLDEHSCICPVIKHHIILSAQ